MREILKRARDRFQELQEMIQNFNAFLKNGAARSILLTKRTAYSPIFMI